MTSDERRKRIAEIRLRAAAYKNWFALRPELQVYPYQEKGLPIYHGVHGLG